MFDHTAAAEAINEAIKVHDVFIGGRKVMALPGGTPATVWGNGSLSVDVKAKRGNGLGNPLWWSSNTESPKIEIKARA